MNKQKGVILVASHLALALTGFLLAGRSTVDSSGPGAKKGLSSGPAVRPERPGLASQTRSRSFRVSKQWKGGEHARAWKAVRNTKLPTRERLRVQRDLLKKWAEVDLAAAIEAALGEAWDDDLEGGYDHNGLLLETLSDALAKNPIEGWEMIQGRQFGVGTGMVKRVWMEAVGIKDPLFLAARLGELSWRDRESAFAACWRGMSNIQGSPKALEVFNVLASLPDDVVTAEQLLGVYPSNGQASVDEIKSELMRLSATDERLAKVQAMLLGRQLAGQGLDEIVEEIHTLPPAVQEEALWAAFKNDRTPGNTLGILDLLIEQDAWSKLEARDTVSRVQSVARNSDAKEVASWATDLPVRKETTELFHRSVEYYFRKDLEGSREWIAEIPRGVWQDRAYAEYSQVALNVHNNAEASRWALNRIGDGTFKQEAESWRGQWEQRTGFRTTK